MATISLEVRERQLAALTGRDDRQWTVAMQIGNVPLCTLAVQTCNAHFQQRQGMLPMQTGRVLWQLVHTGKTYWALRTNRHNDADVHAGSAHQ